MLGWEDLSSELFQQLRVSSTHDGFLGLRGEDIEAAPSSDRNWLQIVDIYHTTTDPDCCDMWFVVVPYIMYATEGSKPRTVLSLLRSSTRESLVRGEALLSEGLEGR